MMTYRNLAFAILPLAVACSSSSDEFDATGNFEAEEVIISSESAGKIVQLNVEEGKDLSAGAVVGYIDTTQLHLRKKQLQYSIRAVIARLPEVSVQLAAVQDQMETAKRERTRIENLLKDDAATQKQLDDVQAQLTLLQRQYDAMRSNLNTTTQSIQSETLPLKAQLEQTEDQIRKAMIVNPINGTVLTKYAVQEEVTTTGKALYKIANLASVTLRAYVSGEQLSQIKLGQNVEVLVDSPGDTYKTYTGTIAWVSDKAEFTPKTIQTKEERANLVYAIKVHVKNDGFLKLGMYGEIRF